MDWMQVLTIVAATIGSTYGFFLIVREDMHRMNDKFEGKFIMMEEKFIRIDEKWERLFEKIMITDKK